MENLLAKDDKIDTIILGCTHYPLLYDTIRKYVPDNIEVVVQGEYVATSLRSYLDRHPAMDAKCTKNGNCKYLTTEDINIFLPAASIFLHESINAETISLQDIIDR